LAMWAVFSPPTRSTGVRRRFERLTMTMSAAISCPKLRLGSTTGIHTVRERLE
jgi:hypothetical protein